VQFADPEQTAGVPGSGCERGVRFSPHPNLKPDAYKTGKNFSSSYGVTCTL
jgi:hypothetical protein